MPELAAVFDVRSLGFGLVVSHFCAYYKRWKQFASRCFCLGDVIRAPLGERHVAAQEPG